MEMAPEVTLLAAGFRGPSDGRIVDGRNPAPPGMYKTL